MTFLKFIISVTGSHGDHSPRAPKLGYATVAWPWGMPCTYVMKALQQSNWLKKYSEFLLSRPWSAQLSPDVPADAGSVCDKAAVLDAAIKGRSVHRTEWLTNQITNKPKGQFIQGPFKGKPEILYEVLYCNNRCTKMTWIFNVVPTTFCTPLLTFH